MTNLIRHYWDLPAAMQDSITRIVIPEVCLICNGWDICMWCAGTGWIEVEEPQPDEPDVMPCQCNKHALIAGIYPTHCTYCEKGWIPSWKLDWMLSNATMMRLAAEQRATEDWQKAAEIRRQEREK